MLRNRWAERADLNRCILARVVVPADANFRLDYFSQPLLMRAGQSDAGTRWRRTQLVGDQRFGRETFLLDQLAHQPQRRPTIAPALNQHVEDLAFVVDGTPQYVRSPAIRTTISSRCQRLLGRGRRRRSRRAITSPNFDTRRRTVHRRCRARLGEEFFDIAIARREAQVGPDRMLDDRWRKAVAAIGDFSHPPSLPLALLPRYPVTLTKPSNYITGAVLGMDGGMTGGARPHWS